MSAPELNEKTPRMSRGWSYAMLVAILIFGFQAGYFIHGMISKDREIDQNREIMRELYQRAIDYTEQEVGGLRSDWERSEKEDQRRITELEKYHKE